VCIGGCRFSRTATISRSLFTRKLFFSENGSISVYPGATRSASVSTIGRLAPTDIIWAIGGGISAKDLPGKVLKPGNINGI
jgi:hypothetical protein